jgi:ADP-heptose:LPS heptosyltransferase
MDQALQRLPEDARIAVIRLRSLGDCVLTTPALALLKQTRPDLRIGVVVEDRFAPIFTGNPAVDGILPPNASELARWKADLALNLHGGTRSAQLTIASRAPLRAAFTHFRFQLAYNLRIPRAQEILGCDRTVHTAEHLASAMFYLGVPMRDIPRARLFATTRSAPAPYAVLHPLASAPDKTWPAASFLAVARHLELEINLEPVFIAGPHEDLSAFNQYRCVAGASLEEIKSLLAAASLFIGNDSGPAHMAAAFGLPVVVFFGTSDPEIWRPWKTESRVLTSPNGIHDIPVTDAIEAVETLSVLQQATHLLPPPR